MSATDFLRAGTASAIIICICQRNIYIKKSLSIENVFPVEEARGDVFSPLKCKDDISKNRDKKVFLFILFYKGKGKEKLLLVCIFSGGVKLQNYIFFTSQIQM